MCNVRCRRKWRSKIVLGMPCCRSRFSHHFLTLSSAVASLQSYALYIAFTTWFRRSSAALTGASRCRREKRKKHHAQPPAVPFLLDLCYIDNDVCSSREQPSQINATLPAPPAFILQRIIARITHAPVAHFNSHMAAAAAHACQASVVVLCHRTAEGQNTAEAVQKRCPAADFKRISPKHRKCATAASRGAELKKGGRWGGGGGGGGLLPLL